MAVYTIKVYETETVEIQWVLKDDSVYVKRYTVPPKPTIDYKEEKEEKKDDDA